MGGIADMKWRDYEDDTITHSAAKHSGGQGLVPYKFEDAIKNTNL